MTGSHFGIELVDTSSTGKISELLVHVVCSSTRVVSQQDGKVLNLFGLLFVELAHCQNFSLGLLHLVKLT